MTASADDVLSRVAKDRAAVYAALSVAFYLPAPDLVWDLRSGSFGQGIARAVAWLGPDADLYRAAIGELLELERALAPRSADEVLHELRVEHARLYTGPGRPAVPAFESEYLDSSDGEASGPLNGTSTARVARWLRESGFGPAAGHRDLPDHVATELEFLHALALDESSLRIEGRSDEAAGRRREVDRFLREHAGRWMPEFARRTLAADPHPFYRSMVAVLAVHVAVERGDPFDRSVLPWAHADASRTRA